MLRRMCRLASQTVQAGVTPSLMSYFFWSSALYLLFATYAAMSVGNVEDFLCTVPPEHSGIVDAGCANCPDTLMLCNKDLCWRTAVAFTYQASARTPDDDLYVSFNEALLDTVCHDLVQTSSNAVQLLKAFKQLQVRGVGPGAGCQRFHCQVLLNSVMRAYGTVLTGPGSCTNEFGTKPASQDSDCPCSGLRLTSSQVDDITALCGPMASKLADAEAVRNIGAKLPCPSEATDAETICGHFNASLLDESSCGWRKTPTAAFTSDDLAVLQSLCWPFGWDFSAASICAPPSSFQGQLACQSSLGAIARRRNEMAPAASSATAISPSNAVATVKEFVTTSWSKCTCYRQCMPGIKKRKVTCLTGSPCQDPPPLSIVPCKCTNCAYCEVTWTIYGITAGYGVVGLTALLLFLAFLFVTKLEDDDLTDMSWRVKALGCFCKFLPIMIYSSTYVASIFVVILLVQSFLPVGTWCSDCKASGTIRMVSLSAAACWLLQMAIGIYMRRNKRMPPALHVASKKGLMSFLCAPLRAIGP